MVLGKTHQHMLFSTFLANILGLFLWEFSSGFVNTLSADHVHNRDKSESCGSFLITFSICDCAGGWRGDVEVQQWGVHLSGEEERWQTWLQGQVSKKNLLTVIWYICEQLGYVNEMQMTYQHFLKVQVNHVQSESGLTRCLWTWLGGRSSCRRSPLSLWACASVLAAGEPCLPRVSLACWGYLSHLTMVHLSLLNALVMAMGLCILCEDLLWL